MNNREITSLWSRLIVEELIRQGCGFFCLSPGSRSTPLTVAVARNPMAKWKTFPDERSAGFFALGHARATGKPAILICTSGTAVANYFPSVVEASMDCQPMIILSADRPFELLETGANQTIRQSGMFGSYSRWNFRLPEPSAEIPLQSVLSAIDHAVEKATGNPPGPVHLNVPFREPFEPELSDLKDPWLAPVAHWIDSAEPLRRCSHAENVPHPAVIEKTAELIKASRQPLFIAGKLDSREDAIAVGLLAGSLGIPLYADLSSGLRYSTHCKPWQLAFQSPAFLEHYRPDMVVHFGGQLISRHPGAAIRVSHPGNYLVVKPSANRYAPDHNVTLSIEASPKLFADALLRDLQNVSLPAWKGPVADEFFTFSEEEIERYCEDDRPVSEISVARIVSRLTGEHDGLFMSNSMPVRDMDLFAAATRQTPTISIAMNRGASGIDGILSTAAGFAEGLQKPVTLVIGDIAFLHDLNALSLLESSSVPLRIIVVNNNGGGIFSFLPIAAEKDVFETHFATPQHYSIASAAATFGVAHASPKTNREFADTCTEAFESNESIVIEITGSREDNVSAHRSLQHTINMLARKFLKKQ
ncbi:MAG: 2-succinyl-5-enolpyruvyl-6-hydroxy-3-cyclohexene-1-carboxylic-acid synthase [Chlorobium phaeobacteroides]|jgi:2-succinyl-5-enolpyruvyl-6-hydroxy-3-cyclohexene-1-carboxylate synthase|nr:2-succinyl-5-enolpyruvyl-6-hydroxy-3-cyclohexene-1-carboxylic-acid synthase [Chlorobium phaeobacteroides]